MIKQSVLGLVGIYNLLQHLFVNVPIVKAFQRMLQDMLRIESQGGNEFWHELFSPRRRLWNHKLISWRLYRDGNDNGNSIMVIATECAIAICVIGWLSFGVGGCGN